MLSFIVIGKNIKHTVEICIDSIFSFCKINLINDFEIIYVDSDSNDGTIEHIQGKNIFIIQIKGQINAAVGRNEGAKVASGEILFFIDGDMEIISDFFPIAFTDEIKLKYPFSTGYFLNKYYDADFNDLKENEFLVENKNDKPIFLLTTGGLFIIEKKYWILLDGMDERLGRNQDLDFGIRMSKMGIPLLRYNKTLVIHHTIKYFAKGRFKSVLKSHFLLHYGILIRKHIFYKKFFLSLLRSRYSMFILLLSLFYFKLIIFYLALQIFRVYIHYMRDRAIVWPLIYNIASDFYCIAGILFFYPGKRQYSKSVLKATKNNNRLL